MSAGDREAVLADMREFIRHAVKGVRGKNMLAVIDRLAPAAPAEARAEVNPAVREAERLFALALIPEGADIVNRVTTHYLESRKFSSIIPGPRPGGEARETEYDDRTSYDTWLRPTLPAPTEGREARETQTQAYVRATAPEGREEEVSVRDVDDSIREMAQLHKQFFPASPVDSIANAAERIKEFAMERLTEVWAEGQRSGREEQSQASAASHGMLDKYLRPLRPGDMMCIDCDPSHPESEPCKASPATGAE